MPERQRERLKLLQSLADLHRRPARRLRRRRADGGDRARRPAAAARPGARRVRRRPARRRHRDHAERRVQRPLRVPAGGHAAPPRPPLRVDPRRVRAPGPSGSPTTLRLPPSRVRRVGDRRPRGRRRRPRWPCSRRIDRDRPRHPRAVRSSSWSASPASGKSTFARAALHSRPRCISSDFCRGLVADDENDQAATPDAFDVLHYIAGKRLRRRPADRRRRDQRAAARPRRRWSSWPGSTTCCRSRSCSTCPSACACERNAARPDRDFGAHVIHRQHRELRRSLRGLAAEGFRKVHVLRGVDEVDAADDHVRAALQRPARPAPARSTSSATSTAAAPSWRTLLAELGYQLSRDGAGRAVGAVHPEGRTAVFVGDLVDRGPDTPGVLRLVMGMVAAGTRCACPATTRTSWSGRCAGATCSSRHGLAESLEQLDARAGGVPRRGRGVHATGWSATTSSTTAGWWSRTPG